MAKNISVSDLDYQDYDAILAAKIKELGAEISMPQLFRIMATFYKQRQKYEVEQ